MKQSKKKWSVYVKLNRFVKHVSIDLDLLKLFHLLSITRDHTEPGCIAKRTNISI